MPPGPRRRQAFPPLHRPATLGPVTPVPEQRPQAGVRAASIHGESSDGDGLPEVTGSPGEVRRAWSMANAEVAEDMRRRRCVRILAYEARTVPSAAGAAPTQQACEAARLRVLVVDPSEAIRSLVADLCRREPDLRLVAVATTGPEVVPMAVAEQPDLLVLDRDLGDLATAQVVNALRQSAGGTRILLYSAEQDVHDFGAALGLAATVCTLDGPEVLAAGLAYVAVL